MKKRNYGIELLRLVLMFMICILHVLGQGGILVYSNGISLKYNVFWAMEIIAFCAVDSFAIISGYTASNKPKKYERIVDLWFQVFFYSFIVTILLTYSGVGTRIGKEELINCFFPITNNKYWYMTAYFALFFTMPIFNKFIFSLNKKTAAKALIIAIFLYSILEIINDPFTTNGGYTTLWIMVLYCIGALVKKVDLFKKRSTPFLISIWIICLTITWWTKILLKNGIYVNYLSPTILMSAIIMVILFSRIKLKGKIISKISPLALGIYLLQLNIVVWNYIIKDKFIFIISKNIIIGVLYILAIALLMFICGLVVEWIRKEIFKIMKIPELSKKIVKGVDRILEKIRKHLK